MTRPDPNPPRNSRIHQQSRSHEVPLVILKLANWRRLNGILDAERKKHHTDRLTHLLSRHANVKMRLEDSRCFASEVLRLREHCRKASAKTEARRHFEAFLFFVMSVVECEMYLVNDLCSLGIDKKKGSTQTVLRSLGNNVKLSSLHAVLQKAAGAVWFGHLKQMRNEATHQSVVPASGWIPRAEGPDSLFILRHLDKGPSGGFGNTLEFGIGEYAKRKLAKVYGLVEQMERELVVWTKKPGN